MAEQSNAADSRGREPLVAAVMLLRTVLSVRRAVIVLLFAAPTALSATDSAETPRIPKQVPIKVVDSSWKQLRTGVYIKENMECSDYNHDGKFDYFRLQDPPGSYQHWVWLDTDYDGYFDKFIGNSEEINGIRIPVPKFLPSRD